MVTPDAAQNPAPRLPWLLALCLLALAAFGIRDIANSDFWMHLATGRLIAQDGLPKADPFAFTTFQDRLWVNPSWFYDLALHFTWRVGGAPLTILLHAAAMVTGIALLLPLARRIGSDTATAGALLVSSWLIAPAFDVSPVPWVILILGVYVRALAAGQPSLSSRVLLCGLQVAWTNMHSSFLLGPVLVMLFAAEHAGAARQQTGSRRAGSRVMRSGMLFAGLLLLLTCLNPYLFGLHRYAIQAVSNPNLTVMLEWVSPFQSDFIPYFTRHASTVALVVVAAGFIVVRGRLPLAVTVLAVLSAFLLVLSPRYFEFSAAMALPFMSLSLQGAGAWLRERLDQRAGVPTRAASMVVAALAVSTLVLVLSGLYYNRTGSASAPGLGVAPGLFPERAAELLLGRSDFPERTINLATDGGYLAWKLPQRKVFTDTRGHVYGVQFYQGLAQALLGPAEAWTNLVKRWEPEGVVLNCSWPGAGAAARRLLNDDRWALVYFDGTTVALVTRTVAHSKLISDYRLQAEGLKALEQERATYLTRIERSTSPRHSTALIGAGAVNLALWRFREAESIYALLTRGAPTMATAWLNLGICQHHRKAYEEAEASLREATRLRPSGVLGWLWLSKTCRSLGETERADAAMKQARQINSTIADSFESEFQTGTNTTLPGVKLDQPVR